MVEFTGERIHAGDDDFRPDVSQHLAAYAATLPLVEGKTVLDAGCGDPGATKTLTASARVVVGVDRSWAVLRKTPLGGGANLHLSCGDVTRLPLREASFDVVCSFQVLEHLARPEALLREVARVLRPGGRLVLTTPNRLASFSENPYHVREYAPDELREIAAPWFSSIEIAGVFGSERVHGLQASRRRHVEAFLALDPLGLRRALPSSVRKRAFAFLARRVRARIRFEQPEAFASCAVSDYEVRAGDLKESLDLFAVCER